jgi:hypothetical protein
MIVRFLCFMSSTDATSWLISYFIYSFKYQMLSVPCKYISFSLKQFRWFSRYIVWTEHSRLFKDFSFLFLGRIFRFIVINTRNATYFSWMKFTKQNRMGKIHKMRQIRLACELIILQLHPSTNLLSSFSITLK